MVLLGYLLGLVLLTVCMRKGRERTRSLLTVSYNYVFFPCCCFSGSFPPVPASCKRWSPACIRLYAPSPFRETCLRGIPCRYPAFF